MEASKILCSSRVFKTSKNRARLLAAMQNPINSELIAQLADAVDVPESVSKPEAPKETETVEDKSNETEAKVPARSEPKEAAHRPTPAKFTPSEATSRPSEKPSEPSEEPQEPEEKNDQEAAPAEVKSSTAVTAATRAKPDLKSELLTLKGTLQSREDLAGVSRVVAANNESEVWVYYNDTVNLNSIMWKAVEIIAEAGFWYLRFNRLARTENAIVFDLDYTATPTTNQTLAEEGTSNESEPSRGE